MMVRVVEWGLAAKNVATKNLGLPSPRQSKEKPDWLFTLVYFFAKQEKKPKNAPPHRVCIVLNMCEKCHRLVHPQFLLLGTASFTLSTYWLKMFLFLFLISYTHNKGGWDGSNLSAMWPRMN